MLKKLDHTTFAEGEVTGHAHRAGGGVLYEDAEMRYDDGPLRVWENDTEIPLTHEEHDTHVIPPSPTGSWQIGGVIAYDPFKEEAKRVAD